jgi:hypothetical protein
MPAAPYSEVPPVPDVKIIVGLCGSGKSHLAGDLAQQGYVVLDEKFAGERFAADSTHLSPRKFEVLVEQLQQGKNCAFTEAMLMFPQVQQTFQPCLDRLRAMKGVTVEEVFFENDLEAANHNCMNDPNREDGTLWTRQNEVWSPMYHIPDGLTPRQIERIPDKEASDADAGD